MLAPFSTSARLGLDLHVGIGRHEVDLVLRRTGLHRRRGRPVDQLLAELGILGALDQRDAFGRRADAFLGEADRDVVALGLGVQRVDDEEDAAARLAQADRQGAAAAALGVELHVRAQLLHVVERLVLVAAVDLEDREDARHRGAGGARVGHLQHVLVGGRAGRSTTPAACRLFSFRNLSLVMNTSGSSAIAVHWPSACLKRAGSLAKDGDLYGSKMPSLDAGGERLDRPAEQHVDARIVLLGDDAGQRLARGEADEVDLDAGRLLELLEHRPRLVLRPDRVDVHGIGGARREGATESASAQQRNGERGLSAWRAVLDYSCSSFSWRALADVAFGHAALRSPAALTAMPVEEHRNLIARVPILLSARRSR